MGLEIIDKLKAKRFYRHFGLCPTCNKILTWTEYGYDGPEGWACYDCATLWMGD
jgi:hypothetical protein